jgi:cytochrome c553
MKATLVARSVVLTAILASTSAFAAETTGAPAMTKGDPKLAEPIVNQVCAACHNADGNSVIPTNPKLAGQGYDYLLKQLTNFKSGDRKSAVMQGIVATLSPDDMKNLAAYFSSQVTKPATAKDATLALEGQKIFRGGVAGAGVPACAACHGAQGLGIPSEFPRLAAQHSEYVYDQLNKFRVGERANDGAKMMRTIAARLTDNDMKAVAAYVQGLR